MINKILCSYLLFACLVAVALKLGGVDGTIHFGSYFKSFLYQCNLELMGYKIAIPDIPSIPSLDLLSTGNWAGDYLLYFVNGITSFVNGIIGFFNIVIKVVNTFIAVIELVFIFLKNILMMKDNIISA